MNSAPKAAEGGAFRAEAADVSVAAVDAGREEAVDCWPSSYSAVVGMVFWAEQWPWWDVAPAISR